ncbi:hypothetical protein AVEN_57234-1 [Araneus ventricosus]|uniref:Uncharacterized protein n=1 Tax=Araneus ventricosus TaxID=182803 RepID=A0A4Y2RM10_ARAVE|nr:hypothetical protein AVEN_57234-1 [Araneus ventricosus]
MAFLAVTISADILAVGHPTRNLQQPHNIVASLAGPSLLPWIHPLGMVRSLSLSDWLAKRFSCPGPPPSPRRLPVKVTGERNFSPFQLMAQSGQPCPFWRV